MLHKIIDKLRGILGRDCDGKPIRVGDRAVCVPSNSLTTMHRLYGGMYFVVAGYLNSSVDGCRWIKTDLPSDDSDEILCLPGSMRVIKGDKGDWKEISKQTGWKPGVTRKAPSEETRGRDVA